MRMWLPPQEIYDYLRSICADVHVTKGDFDDVKGYPEDEVLSIGDFRIGLCHGHQVQRALLGMDVAARPRHRASAFHVSFAGNVVRAHCKCESRHLLRGTIR